MTIPRPKTLRRYGLTAEAWLAILERQGGTCAICRRPPEEYKHRLCIDHQHVRGWRRLPPTKRAQYVRGLACSYCNRRLLAKGITTERARAIWEYLRSYEAARLGSVPAAELAAG